MLVGFVGFNLIANNLTQSSELDMTEEKFYTLDRDTIDILQSLEHPVTAKLYFSDILIKRNSNFRHMFDRVKMLLSHYKEASNSKFDYRIYHPQNLDKIEEMDNYVIQHFRIAFGNRIVAHMKKFVPVFVACGGDEVDGIDYFIARKILRKFEQLNIAYIRDEIDGFVDFLNKEFGENKMHECIEYLLRLKKMA